jgi:hypothetical protein
MGDPSAHRRSIDSDGDTLFTEHKIPLYYGIYTAIGTGVLGFSTAYGLWLARGCAALPMISDLGLRPPEAYVFNGTVGMIVPLAALSAAGQSQGELYELRKQGKTIALWCVTVFSGLVAAVGGLMAGLTAWDYLFWTHFWGAILFFAFSMLYCLGELGVWVQLGYLRPNVPSSRSVKFAWIFLLVTFVAACVGMPCFVIFGPDPPCEPGVDPADGVQCVPESERFNRFDAICIGTNTGRYGAINTFGGNVMSTMEWVVFMGIALSLTCIILQGTRAPADVRERLLGRDDV